MIFMFSMAFIFSACDDNEPVKDTDLDLSLRQITVDQDRFDQSWSSLQTDDPISDPFELNSLSHVGTTLVIGVSYSGGCAEHGFELVWPEVITMVFPPRYTVILNHDDKGDLCEAYPSDTLHFDLSKYDLGLAPDVMDLIDLTIVNGSNGDETLTLN